MTESDLRLAPGILVAVPQLEDPNFARSVVLLITHSNEGSFGLVLNRPSDIDLRAVAAQLGISGNVPEQQVYVGGPVETNRGFLLHGGASMAASEEVQPGVHLSGAPEDLQRCFRGRVPFRLFVGYAGWGPGQLDREITSGSWIAAPLKAEYVFGQAPDRLWETVLNDVGIQPGAIASGGGVN